MAAAAPARKSLGKNLMLAYPGTCRKGRCGNVESDGRQQQGSKEPTNRLRQQQTNAQPAGSKAVRGPRHICSHIASRTQSHLGLGDRSMTTLCKTSTASPRKSVPLLRGTRVAYKLIRPEVGTCRVRFIARQCNPNGGISCLSFRGPSDCSARGAGRSSSQPWGRPAQSDISDNNLLLWHCCWHEDAIKLLLRCWTRRAAGEDVARNARKVFQMCSNWVGEGTTLSLT